MFKNKTLVCLIVTFLLMCAIITNHTVVYSEEKLGIQGDNYCLIEADTGTILAENNSDKEVSPASITKIMTLLLTCERIDSGKLKLDDKVTTSAYAKSMGGSQVFLEEGEEQTVEDIIKCIVISSGNDASVAMAEHIAGSEEEFVARMNEKAQKLGMVHTHFIDCCGLTDSDEHYSSARDVAIMSRELITKHSYILKYSSVWMDKIIHVTKKGESEFVLSNTNKLLKINKDVVGLKTGSTSKAGYCVSAVAKKNNLTIIAVVMGAKDHKIRFADANKLLKYGVANCRKYEDKRISGKGELSGGKKEFYKFADKHTFTYLLKDKEKEEQITKKIELNSMKAPIKQGENVGKVIYSMNGKKIGSNDLFSIENVEKANLFDCIRKLTTAMLCGV